MSDTENAKRGPGRPRSNPSADPAATPLSGLPPAGAHIESQVGEAKLRQQEEAEEAQRRNAEIDRMNLVQLIADREDAAQALAHQQAEDAKSGKKQKLIEVQLRRDYAPYGSVDDDGNPLNPNANREKVPAGTTVSLPKKEAERALRLGLAVTTENTFND